MTAVRKQVRRASGCAVALLLGVLCVGGTALAKVSPGGSPGPWITADRIVGFVPFTVYVYGTVKGSEPGDLELCRSEVAWITDASAARVDSGGVGLDAGTQQFVGGENPCAKGRMERTPDGFQYRHDMHFDRPGVYHVRLMMVDGTGHRFVSNTLRVSAF